MQMIRTLLTAMGAIVIGAVIGEIPPLPRWFASVDAHHSVWLLATGSAAFIGFALMMGGILALVMSRDVPLGHGDAEDVTRSVRMAPLPVAFRSTAYRVRGDAHGRSGDDQFSFREMKNAWRAGAWRRDPVWRRRFLTTAGALCMTIGLFGVVFTLGPSPVRVIVSTALLYAAYKTVQGFSKA